MACGQMKALNRRCSVLSVRSEMNIPNIIHQTWKSQEIPEEWKSHVASWKRFHPDWEYLLRTDEDNREFIKEYYPEILSIYDSYTYNIQRADAVRYLILHKFGGLYADMDIECLAARQFILGLEPDEHAKDHGIESIISNALMISIPGHPFLSSIIDNMLKTGIDQSITFHDEVLSSTGPIMISNILKTCSCKNVTVLPSYVFSPYISSSNELLALLNRSNNYHYLKKQCLKNGTFAIHYWANTWVRNLAGDLINPDPYDVQGYSFYQGMDSPGYDIGNASRDIQKLTEECNKRHKAVGFNTDGFLKYHIAPFHQLTPMEDSMFNEGLYIKKAWEHFVKYRSFASKDK